MRAAVWVVVFLAGCFGPKELLGLDQSLAESLRAARKACEAQRGKCEAAQKCSEAVQLAHAEIEATVKRQVGATKLSDGGTARAKGLARLAAAECRTFATKEAHHARQ